jgi:dipeptidyl aminopeptidase/acylaminoacyl peptidase
MNRIAPHGSWESPLRADLVARAGRRLSQPRLDRDSVYWLEGRPSEGGRQVVVRTRGAAGCEDVTPESANVRTLVHEYGGGDFLIRTGELFFVDLSQPGIQRLGANGLRPLGGTLPSARYADFDLSPDGRWLLAVEEEHREGSEPANRIVAFALESGARRVIAAGHDFVSTPRFSPRGDRLAYLGWEHPNMPWDGTTLYVVGFAGEGEMGTPRPVAGGRDESIFQPSFSPAGRLTFVSDRSGWWNLYQERDSEIIALCSREAEFGLPQWVFGMSTYGFADEQTLICSYRVNGSERLARLEIDRQRLADLPIPYTSFDGLDVCGRRACFIGASTATPSAICRLDLDTGRVEELRRGFEIELDPGFLSPPEAIEFPSADGRSAYAFLYRPANPLQRAPQGERPPLIVKSHGGPTSATSSALKLGIQYWTSRGFAVADVNYGGSTGYGRAFRELLRGAWGIVDVDDCIHAALFAASQGLADSRRMAVSGGSAGGYTTLCALTFRDVFGAGASHYGVGDLEALTRDTHKFESRYLDGLVGPYPERRDLYLERSPIHHTARLSCPIIFFQGLEDRIVPPSQAEQMVAALAGRGIAHAYVPFEGEQHGFRRAENIETALEGELFFYAHVFDFPVDVSPRGVRIVGERPGRI